MNWGLGIGDWGLGPIPNPQSPIPYNIIVEFISLYILINEMKLLNKLLLNLN